MKWTILTVGKPGLDFAARGAAEYFGRLKRMGEVEWVVCRELPAEKGAGQFWLVLDERGEPLTTDGFRRRVDRWELAACKRIWVMIGGADGHRESTRRQADFLMGLSALTLQHELALVVFLEQLYRVYTLKRGEPYHR
jgi:23S rRNA (pseudouridine1915-N3)-methyltransferase